MPVTDPIADMLTRIRNAVRVRHDHVNVPDSRMKSSLLRLLQNEGFISGVEPFVENNIKMLRIALRYYEDREPVIHGLERISKPGLRVYVGKTQIPRYYGGLGVSIVSTSKGVLTGRQAYMQGIGGELLFYVW